MWKGNVLRVRISKIGYRHNDVQLLDVEMHGHRIMCIMQLSKYYAKTSSARRLSPKTLPCLPK